jgi:D-serine deaminase-like pyridoxal phosphate-dependent protein
VVYSEIVDANIATTLRLLGGRAERWRPHVKTAKLAFTMSRLLERGVTRFKCATSLELLCACQAGADDVVVAYPVLGAGARRVRQIAERHAGVRISALVEAAEQIGPWAGGTVGLFVDINPGMDRTGIEQARDDDIVALAGSIVNRGLAFRGLHYYDGQLGAESLAERESTAHRGYDRLMEIVARVEESGVAVGEVITSGTPALPCVLSYRPFESASFAHRVSPGTVVYNDLTSLAQLPGEYGYRPAALVLSTVVSRPSAGRVTCDAGHKTVSADAGVPTCSVMGRPDLRPGRPSEEHLPIGVPPGAVSPALGELLYLVPRHVCPTVNNFDHAILVSGARVRAVERVTARGREAPLLADR